MKNLASEEVAGAPYWCPHCKGNLASEELATGPSPSPKPTHMSFHTVLGEAAQFAVLGATSVTIKTSIINGGAGVYPGKVFSNDTASDFSAPIFVANDFAKIGYTDLVSAQKALSAMDVDSTITTSLDGLTFTPGVYKLKNPLLTSTVTLDCEDDTFCEFVFISTSGMIVAHNAAVVYKNDATRARIPAVFWNIDGDVSISTYAIVEGSIMATGDISVSFLSSTGPLLSSGGSVDIYKSTASVMLVDHTDFPTVTPTAMVPTALPTTRGPTHLPTRVPTKAPSGGKKGPDSEDKK